jgi:hypothetical protein
MIYSRLHSPFHYIQQATQHIPLYTAGYTAHSIIYSRLHSTFHYIQQATQHISLYTAGYTAHFTQLNKFSENNIFGRKTVCDTALSPTCYTFNALHSVP